MVTSNDSRARVREEHREWKSVGGNEYCQSSGAVTES